jgi:hypothetical protein
MGKNSNLHRAKKAACDEFYTLLTDIEKELSHYKEYFRNKIVFCNCDDPEESNFWKYFELNFEHLGLKKLVSTHYETDKPSYKLELFSDVNGDGKINKGDVIKTPLKQNGDFRSPECIEILKECDVVVTNPPFSLFREYVAQLVEYNKYFLIIGSKNAITYKEIFKLIKENKLWLGYNYVKEFKIPMNEKGETTQKFGNIGWFTNLPINKSYDNLRLYRTYKGNEHLYPKYDNYDAINVDKVSEIPVDYDGVMGVPITFLDHYNPTQNQFDIVKFRKGDDDKDLIYNSMGRERVRFNHTSESSSEDVQNSWDSEFCSMDWRDGMLYKNKRAEIIQPSINSGFKIIGQGQGNLYRELTTKGLSVDFVNNYYKTGGTGTIKEDHPVLGYYDKNGKAVIPYMRILIQRENN